MRGVKFFSIFIIILLLCMNSKISCQSKDELSKSRGVTKLIINDSKTGEKEIINLYNKVYGIIIGIDMYENLHPGDRLRYAVSDAEGMEKMLKERFVFDEIFTLFDKDATREAIMALLMGKLSQTEPDDAVFVFFSGHGHTATTKYGELGYLVPYDGTFDNNELYKNISMNQLKEDVSKRILAKHVFFMVDACYSGLLVTRGIDVDTSRNLDYLRKITAEPSRQVLTAGSKGEKVLDGGPYGHSVFVGRILQILENTTDYITASELSVKVKEKVYSDARAMGRIQTPTFGKLFGMGDFVFVPKLGKRYEEVLLEVSRLQLELDKIELQKQEFKIIKKEKKAREAERKAEEIKAQLKIKKMEEVRLLEEKKIKKRLEEKAERDAQEEEHRKAEMERKKVAEEERLKQLRQKLAEEEKKLKDIKQEVLSIDAARREVAMLEAKINSITSKGSKEDDKNIKQIKSKYEPMIDKLKREIIPPKGQFETTAAYNARIKKHNDKIRAIKERCDYDLTELRKRYHNELDIRTAIYKDQIKELKSKKYPTNELKVELLNYFADEGLYHVKLMDNRHSIWFYSLPVKPDFAQGLADRKDLLRAYGFYMSLDNPNYLSEVFLKDPILGKRQLLITNIKLRSDYMTLNYNEAISMMRQKGFFDSYNNPDGGFKNQFELVNIAGDNVVVDLATNLMWYNKGAPLSFGLLRSSTSRAKRWIKKLNKKRYAGFNDWRLPTLEEAASLLENEKIKSRYGLYVDLLFFHKELKVLTGDKEKPDKDWVVDFGQGRILRIPYNEDHALLDVYAVRSLNSQK